MLLPGVSVLVARAAAVFIEELELIEQSGCDVDVAALWAALEEVAPRAALSSAATVVVSLVPEDDGTAESALRGAPALRYNAVKPFLSLLGESKALGAATGGMRGMTGVKRLPALSQRKVGEKPLLPREIDDKLVPSHGPKAVYANAEPPQGAVDRDAYVVCVLEQLFRALKRRDDFASPSHRWSDPRARLLDGKGWEAVREDGGRPGRAEPGGGLRGAPAGADGGPGRDVEADGRAPGGGRRGREDQYRGAAERPDEAERAVLGQGPARRRRRPALRRPRPHHQRSAEPQVLREEEGHHLAERDQ